MDEKSSPPPGAFPPTLLESVPPTPEDVLMEMEANRAVHKHYSAIGRVAAVWSFSESLIDTQSLLLAKVNWNAGVCFTSQIAGSGRKLDAYISLARLLKIVPQETIKQLNEFSQRTTSLAERRNRIVHDVWYFNHPDPPERLEATAKRLLRLELVPTTTQELLDFSGKIIDHSNAFDALSKRIQALPDASPGTRLRGIEP
jgi:hypothetical protein